MRITVKLEGLQEALKSVHQLQTNAQTMRKAWDTAGQYMVGRTVRERFGKEQSPEGVPWKKRSEATEKHYLKKYGPAFVANKVLQFHGELKKITHIADEHGVIFGTNKKYGPVHQYGMKRGQGGTVTIPYAYKDNARNKKLGKTGAQYTRTNVIPWGDIPARPFLGVNNAEWVVIRRIITDHITGNIRTRRRAGR